MRNEIDRKISEFRRDAARLIGERRNANQKMATGSNQLDDKLDAAFEAINEEFEDTIEGLETALNQLSEMTEENIARHPIASVAAAFAIGILIGRISKSQE